MFLFSINSIAAIVSDNDGAAFVTKAEFEALKEDFASQVDQYNTSIDSKIDGAIAAYLAGTRLSKKEVVKLDNTFNWKFPIFLFGSSDWNNINSKYYSYEVPDYQNISMVTRSGQTGGSISALGWNGTSALSSSIKQTDKAVAFRKGWIVTKEIYNEMIELSDQTINRSLSGTSLTCYKLKNVGKGRHKIEQFSHGAEGDAGHTQGSVSYYGYTGVLGVNVSGHWGKGNEMVASQYANWQFGTWTRKNGTSNFSSMGWGVQHVRAFVLPADGLTLTGARSWAANYTANGQDYAHDQPRLKGIADATTLTTSITWKDENKNHRSYAFSGNSDAPATSEYGWYFNFQKPSNANVAFEGYVMTYNNDLALALVGENNIWGFHSWAPAWYWRYTAGGSIGTKPSTSEFSKLPAKQIYYYDRDSKLHFCDEGLFLFNMPGTPQDVEFDAKWSVLDSSITSEQKIALRISKSPFDSSHNNADNLQFQVNSGTTSASQEVVCNANTHIKVLCDESVKQLYMTWWPVTSGTYLGLSQLSDFTVSIEQ